MIQEQPKWCYKPVEVPNLIEIQEELKKILYVKQPSFDEMTVPNIFYVPVKRDEIESTCPLYTKYIESTGLLDRWEFSLLSIIVGNKPERSEKGIHIDTANWQYRCYGLNLPIINCEGTYTVWYEGTLNDNPVDTSIQRLQSAKFLRTDLPHHEIARIESCNPAWVNVTIPHVPINMHGKPRAAISARFTPEVHEYFV